MTASTVIVNDVEPRRQYTATAAQTMFDFPIPFFGVEDVTVWLTPSGQSADDAADLLAITTDYTVTGEGTQDGGLITLVNGAAAGDIVTIERIVAIERLADYQTAGDLLAETLNEEQDTEIFIAQQLRQDIDRSVKRSTSSTSSADLTLPEPEANKFLKWKVDVSGLENGAAETPNDASEVSYSQGGTGSVSRTVEQKLQESVSVKDFGAVGDGATDDTAKFQAAVDAINTSGGGVLLVPAGTYKLSNTLNLASNVHIKGDGIGATILKTNSGTANPALWGQGSVGSEFTGTADYTVGTDSFTMSGSHGFAVDDIVRVIGQRNSLSDSADDDWRLGYGTPGSGIGYYGEFLQVKTEDGTTGFTSYSGLSFPDYRNDVTEEVTTLSTTGAITIVAGETLTQAVSGATGVVVDDFNLTDALVNVKNVTGTFDTINTLTGSSSGALGASSVPTLVDASTNKAATTFQKVTPIENVTVSNITFELEANTSAAVRFRYGFNCHVVDCDVKQGDFTGAAVFLHDCLDCHAHHVSASYGPNIDLIGNKANYNAFKMAGAQSCTVSHCTSRNGSQGVDFTFFNEQVITMNCGAYNNTVSGAQISGLTSHGGSYAITFSGNKILNARQGISCRSRSSILTDNTATYISSLVSSDATHYAFGVFEGWARDCVMSGNTAQGGFFSGYSVVDGADLGECFGYTGLVCTGNTANNCRYGFHRESASLNVKTEHSGTIVENNIFRKCNTRFVYLEGKHPGTIIRGNVCDTLIVGSDGIRVGADAHPHTVIENNWIKDCGLGVDCIEVDGQTLTYPYTTNFTCTIRGNVFVGTHGTKVNISSTHMDHNLYSTDVAGREGAFPMIDGVTAPNQISGYAFLYVDTADGDLKIKFGDGTVKTITTDV